MEHKHIEEKENSTGACCSREVVPEGSKREESKEPENPEEKRTRSIRNAILGGALIVGVAIVTASAVATQDRSGANVSVPASGQKALAAIEESVAPSKGIEIPVAWGDLGKQMIAAGVIDQAKFEELYEARGGMSPDIKAMLTGSENGRIRMTRENSNGVLNLFWALGLGNKNEILEKGEMMNPRFEAGPGGFASTGGWTLAMGGPMDHYSMHRFVTLDASAQEKVERVTKNIYRPCCGNSTHFPDCNHGMAMLGLMELMASQGASEEDMYRVALQVNSYWFPEQYVTIAKVLAAQGVAWDKADPKQILGADYSSATGFQQVAQVASQLANPEGGSSRPSSGGGCGV